jgi:peptide/nickel transport system permease protein
MAEDKQQEKKLNNQELGPAKLSRSDYWRFLGAKLRDLVFTLWLMSLIVFLIFYIIPGDTVTMLLGTEATPEKRAALEAELNLDQPPLERYRHSLRGLWDPDDPSISLRFRQPVRDLIAPRLGLSLGLALYGFVLIVLLSLPLSIISAWWENSWIDKLTSSLAQIFMAVPGFFLGILLILLFAFAFSSFQVGNYQPATADFWGHLQGLFLPALALALPKVAQAQQFFRAELVKAKSAPYVRTARSKGAGSWRVLFCHMFRNSLRPFVTSLGLILAELITGSLVVEQVFVLPGMGRLLFTAIETRDLPLAQGLILTIAALVILLNALVDLLNALIDPRIIAEQRARSKKEAV